MDRQTSSAPPRVTAGNVTDGTDLSLRPSARPALETPGGADYRAAQYDQWCWEAGFTHTDIVPLAGPTSAAIVYK
jgi:hypothetical protein